MKSRKQKTRSLYIDGFKINKHDEMRFQSKNYNSTYGELTKHGVSQLFGAIPLQGKIFCDLGSGVGNVLQYVLSQCPSLKQGIGVELSEERHASALIKCKQGLKQGKIALYCDDLLQYNIGHCDVIYISNLCFPNHLNISIGKKIDKEAKKDAIVFSSKEIYCNNHWKMESLHVSQTWDTKSVLYKYYL